MKYSLRSLMLAALLGPPLLAGVFFVLAAFNVIELQTLLVVGIATLVLLASVVSAFRGEM